MSVGSCSTVHGLMSVLMQLSKDGHREYYCNLKYDAVYFVNGYHTFEGICRL